MLFESPGPPVAGEGDEWKRRLIGDQCPVGRRGVTMTKTTEDERRQKTTGEVSGTGSGVTNPGIMKPHGEGSWLFALFPDSVILLVVVYQLGSAG